MTTTYHSDVLYYLMDLERTITLGAAYYWKPFKRGYTTNLEEAGEYGMIEAWEISKSDRDNRTVLVPKEVVEKLIGA